MSCEACRTIPPVQAKDYVTKGKYEQVAGLNTYVTGSPTATVGLIAVYDVFAMVSQTLQGADAVAAALDAVVLVPDFFQGESAQWSWIPPDTPEKEKALRDFITTGPASFERNTPVVLKVVEEAKGKFGSVSSWGAYGLCWGGKMLALTSRAKTPFTASGQVHPGLMEKSDAEKLTIPHIVLASKDEPADVVTEYKKIIDSGSIGGHVETYTTMVHGWMSARADFEDEENIKEYTRGYDQLVIFFAKYLK